MTTQPRSPTLPKLQARAASAGTGKTTAIVGDVLRSLPHIPLRRIAVVTFTQSGAADLRLRLEAGIRQVLKTGKYFDLEVYPAQLPAYQAALDEVGGATITTIHGFFRKLLKLCAPDLGLDPHFDNTDALESDALFADAASAVLAGIIFEDHTSGKHLLANLGWDGTLKVLWGLRHSRAQGPFKADKTSTLEPELLNLYNRIASRTWARQAGRSLDPDDVEEQTLRLCGQNILLERIRERYQMLLVDEFQDVNPKQAQIFERLALPQTQMVGDPKQSIYAFRNADVDSFLRLFANSSPLPQLTHSYRHGPRLAQIYSHIAEKFFPDFAELGIYNHVTGMNQDRFEQPLEAALIECDTLEQGRRVEAQWLAQKLSSLHPSGGGAFSWSQMAILIRNRSSLGVLRTELAKAGIPLLVQGGIGFFERRELRDAALLLNARDLIPIWQETAPSAADSQLLAGLSQLPTIGENPWTPQQNWQTYLQNSPRVQALLQQIANTAGDAAQFLTTLWESLPLEHQEANATANLQALLRELNLRGLSDSASAARFLESARASKEADEPLGGQDAVNVMTVHGSKGLEFEIAALFDLSRESSQSRARILVHPFARTIALEGSALYQNIVDIWKVREEGENLRLLYVALTRAKSKVLLTGSHTRYSPRGWMKTLEPFFRAQIEGCLILHLEAKHIPNAKPIPSSETPIITAQLEADPQLAQGRIPAPGPVLFSPSRHARPEDAPALPQIHSRLPDIPEIGRVLGVLCHAAIAANLEPDQVDKLAHQLILAPYPPEEQKTILLEVETLLAHYQKMYPLERRLARIQDQAELSFCFEDGGKVWNGILDRLYLEKNTTGNTVGETWVLEDYKTDAFPEDAIHFFVDHYTPQMRIYYQALRKAGKTGPLEVRLCFLRLERVVFLNFG